MLPGATHSLVQYSHCINTVSGVTDDVIGVAASCSACTNLAQVAFNTQLLPAPNPPPLLVLHDSCVTLKAIVNTTPFQIKFGICTSLATSLT